MTRDVKAHEFSPEEIAELDRLDTLYDKLSEEELSHIVWRWDDANGLEPACDRLKRRGEAPLRAWRRKFWTTIAVLLAVILYFWIGRNYVDGYNEGQVALYEMNYLREKAPKNPTIRTAIEEAERDYAEWLESQRPDDY